MIKYRMKQKNGRDVIGLGITGENVKKMQEGDPIFVQGDELGLPGVDIMIHHGKSEQALIADLQKAGLKMPWEAKS